MIRWYSAQERKDTSRQPVVAFPADSYAQIMADAAQELATALVAPRHTVVPLMDATSVPETEQELRELVLTAPLIAAVFKAGVGYGVARDLAERVDPETRKLIEEAMDL